MELGGGQRPCHSKADREPGSPGALHMALSNKDDGTFAERMPLRSTEEHCQSPEMHVSSSQPKGASHLPWTVGFILLNQGGPEMTAGVTVYDFQGQILLDSAASCWSYGDTFTLGTPYTSLMRKAAT